MEVKIICAIICSLNESSISLFNFYSTKYFTSQYIFRQRLLLILEVTFLQVAERCCAPLSFPSIPSTHCCKTDETQDIYCLLCINSK